MVPLDAESSAAPTAMQSMFSSRLQFKAQTKPSQSQAFTLVELLIVVIIIGVLSAIGIPSFLNQAGKARAKAADTAAMGAARSCAALRTTAETASWLRPNGVTAAATCPAAGTAASFTSNQANVTTQAVATISASEDVTLNTTAVP